MMPTYTINCQMIIRAGKAFRYLFRQALFSFSLSKLISSILCRCFLQIRVHVHTYTHTHKPHKMRIFAKYFKQQGYDGWNQKTRSSNSRVSYSPASTGRLPPLVHCNLNSILRVTALLWIPSLCRYVLPPWCYLDSFLLTRRQWTVLL